MSVLIPAYNVGQYIGDAIKSVLLQDYTDWDIVVVDDKSTDNTVDVVTYFIHLSRGKEISLLQLSKHQGCAAVTKAGIKACRGPVITVLDGDDWLLRNSLSRVVPLFEDKKLGFVWTNWQFPDGREGWCRPVPGGTDLFSALKLGWWKASAQRFFRKKCYQQSRGLDTSIRYAVDLQLALCVSSTGCLCKHVPEVTYTYRQWPGQMSRRKLKEQTQCAKKLPKMF